MVPKTGLEPVRPKTTDFKSAASTIPPLRHDGADNFDVRRVPVRVFFFKKIKNARERPEASAFFIKNFVKKEKSR